MGRIERCFRLAREQRRPALMTYLVAADPSIEMTRRLAVELRRAGTDLIELGVPCSAPNLDGKVIRAANRRGLRNTTRLADIFELVSGLRKELECPIILLAYAQSLSRYGPQEFARHAAAAGVDGVIVPDLAIDAASTWKTQARRAGLAPIFLIPAACEARHARRLACLSSGFVYCAAHHGPTGVRASLADDLFERLATLRQLTRKPVAVGFGISTPAHVRQLAPHVDGIIVGSAIVRIIARHADHPDLVSRLGKFVFSLSRVRATVASPWERPRMRRARNSSRCSVVDERTHRCNV